MAVKIAIVIVILVTLVGIGYIVTRPQTTEPVEQTTETVEEVVDKPLPGEEEAMDADGNVVEVNLTASNFEYSQDTIEVKHGDTVTITLNVEEGMHDWSLDEFGAATEVVEEGETTEVTFVADEIGEFEYYCSVGNHREMGMVGALVVTE